jgi:hypothetical protein
MDTKKIVTKKGFITLGWITLYMLMACTIASSATYAITLGSTYWHKAVILVGTVAVEMLLIFLSASLLSRSFAKSLGYVSGILACFLSLAGLSTFFVGQKFEADNGRKIEARLHYDKTLQSSSQALVEAQQKALKGGLKDNYRANSLANQLAIVRNRQEQSLKKGEKIEGSQATAFFHYLAPMLGVDAKTLIVIFTLLLALTIVSGSIALSAILEDAQEQLEAPKNTKTQEHRNTMPSFEAKEQEISPQSTLDNHFLQPIQKKILTATDLKEHKKEQKDSFLTLKKQSRGRKKSGQFSVRELKLALNVGPEKAQKIQKLMNSNPHYSKEQALQAVNSSR